MEKIILASQSPRRKQLLEWAEIDFEVMVSEADETFPHKLAVADVPVFIAKQKALAIQNKLANTTRTIIAADTVVVLNNTIIGKPNSKEEAIKILSALSGKTHVVITGVVIKKAEKEIAFADITEVVFHTLTQAEIEFYITKYKPYDKAGAYAIQEWIGVVGIQQIKGDFYNVMGLPVSRVVKALQQL